jgi:hypothetical protein
MVEIGGLAVSIIMVTFKIGIIEMKIPVDAVL